MNYGRMLGQYERTSVESASKVELVVLCYEKAIQFLAQARRYYEDREFAKKGMALQKVLNIINELQASLNFDQGGQIARNLDRTYSYISGRLLLADFNMDLTIFDEVIRILSELKQAWEYVASNETGGKATPVTSETAKSREMDRAAA